MLDIQPSSNIAPRLSKCSYHFIITANTISILKPSVNRKLPDPHKDKGFIISFTPDFLHSCIPSPTLIQAFLSANIDQLQFPEEERQFLTDITQRMSTEPEKNMLFRIFILYIDRLMTDTSPGLKTNSFQQKTNRFVALLGKYQTTHQVPARPVFLPDIQLLHF